MALRSDSIPRNRIIVQSSKPLVTCVLRSGLGNRLFQIIAGLGYAERTEKQFVFHERHILENSHTGLRSTMDILLAIFPQVKFWRGIGIVWSNYKEDPERFYSGDEPCGNGSVILHGYFQNSDLFPIDFRAKFKIPKPPNCVNTIVDLEQCYFVHFRLGDYVESQYDVGLELYYLRAIGKLLELGGVKFLIFSDEPGKLTLPKFGLTGENSTIVKCAAWETLYWMSQCSGGVCANSTFSWFGGYGCKGDRIYMPSVWIKNNPLNPVPKWAIEVPVV